MKAIILSIIAICLMIGAPLGVWASFRPGPTVSEDGKSCAYGPNHDMCLSGFLESIPGTRNAIDHAAGFKVGYYDFIHEGIYHHLKAEDNAPSISWGNGYFDGWGTACIKAGNSDDQCGSWEDYSTHEDNNPKSFNYKPNDRRALSVCRDSLSIRI